MRFSLTVWQPAVTAAANRPRRSLAASVSVLFIVHFIFAFLSAPPRLCGEIGVRLLKLIANRQLPIACPLRASAVIIMFRISPPPRAAPGAPSRGAGPKAASAATGYHLGSAPSPLVPTSRESGWPRRRGACADP